MNGQSYLFIIYHRITEVKTFGLNILYYVHCTETSKLHTVSHCGIKQIASLLKGGGLDSNKRVY